MHKKITTCSIFNCDKPAKNHGVCEMHYYRMRRNGNYYKKRSKTRPVEFEVDDNGCFIVTSHKPLNTGYFHVTKNGIRKTLHRDIYEECFGDIPKGLVVRHKCDVRSCINPEHLELGTPRDNVNDTVSRNRTLRGMRHPRSKLDETTVRKIKEMIFRGERNCDIARALKVNTSTICNIKHGKNWTHIG